jgi:aminopeptidase YwaD
MFRYLLIFSIFIAVESKSQDLRLVRRHIDTLASPIMKGRGYTGNGEKLAATYIRQYFKQYHLQAFDTSYFQPFQLSINTFPGEMQLKNGRKVLVCGQDYILAPDAPSLKGKYKLTVLDTLIFTDTIAQKWFLHADLKKTALALSPAQKSRLKTLPKPFNEKLKEAPVMVMLQPKKLTASVAASQATQLVIDVLKDSINLEAKNLKLKIEAKIIPDYATQNVIGWVKGTQYPDSFIVISAHYDHLGMMGSETYFPGANDNASGIAMLLSLADYYSQHPAACSIMFIAFGAEEAGLIGSSYFVNHPLVALSKIKFVMNLDLAGTGDEGATVVNGAILTKEFDLLVEANQEGKYLTTLNKRGKAKNSDHYYFSEKGVKSFFLYTLGGITAYHDIYDTSAKLPLTKFKELYQLMIAFMAKL